MNRKHAGIEGAPQTSARRGAARYPHCSIAGARHRGSV
jgi:hypothetical protein